MTRILIEFARPDGAVLRHVDAGFEYIDSAQIPWANAERRIRVVPNGELLAEPVPLPDGLQSTVRVAAALPVAGGSSVLKARVKIDGMTQELVVRVSTELKNIESERVDDRVNPTPPNSGVTTSKPNDDSQCPKCGSPLCHKQISVGGKYVRFLACSDYPVCFFTRDLPKG